MFLINSKRRSFLKAVAGIAVASLPVAGSDQYADSLSIFLDRNGTQKEIAFAQNGVVVEDGYLELCYLLKDVKADAAVQMDVELLSIMARAQRWLRLNGYDEPIIVTSGYRTVATNAMLEGASLNSMHLYGKAVDIKLKSLSPNHVGEIFRAFGARGVGIYPTFTHIDTWRTRKWRG